jgi:hypothetical protein
MEIIKDKLYQVRTGNNFLKVLKINDDSNLITFQVTDSSGMFYGRGGHKTVSRESFVARVRSNRYIK